jgi:hypothetical protein
MNDLEELRKLAQQAELLKDAPKRYAEALAEQKRQEVKAKNQAAVPALESELETEMNHFTEAKQASDAKIKELILQLELECQITGGTTPANNSNCTAPNYGHTTPLIYGPVRHRAATVTRSLPKKIEPAKVVGS